MTQAAAATDTNEVRAPRRGAILVVEDRDDVRLGLAQLLEYHGYVVTDAGDGETALGRLHSSPDNIALILLDLMLPGAVGGRDIRARQQVKRPATISTHNRRKGKSGEQPSC